MSKRERIMERCRMMFILEFGVGCAGVLWRVFRDEWVSGGVMLLLDKALGNKFFCLVGLDDLLGGNEKRIIVDAGWLSRAAGIFPARSTRTLLGRLQRFESSCNNFSSLHCCFV